MHRPAARGVVVSNNASGKDTYVKHIDRTLIATGVALVLSGGIASAAIASSSAPSGGSLADTVAGAVAGGFAQVGGFAPGQMDHGFGGPQFMAAAATYIGITEAQLRTELGTDKSLADVAVAHGKTRDGLIAALGQAATQQITQLVDQKGVAGPPAGGGPGFPGGPGVTGDSFAAAATYLGISVDDLRTKVSGGQTLAAIANATAGKSRDGLVKALVDDASAKIDQAVKDGKITADQATQLKSGLNDRIVRLVDSTAPLGGPRGHR